MMKRYLTLLVTGLVAVAGAWNDTGHMLVASIAEARLNEKARAECLRLLTVGGSPRTNTFDSAACWADDVRRDRAATGPWHYIDLPFRDDHKKPVDHVCMENIVWAIETQTAILADRTQPDEKRSEALRFVMHFVGDIHQPLHGSDRQSDAHPDGDRGGNDFKIGGLKLSPESTREVTNLHSLWDSGAGAFLPIERPESLEARNYLRAYGRSLEANFPSRWRTGGSPKDWARESFDLARSQVYRLKEGSVPDEKYLREGQLTSGRRVVQAGIRLAALLNKALGE
jgi:hypothetical protein